MLKKKTGVVTNVLNQRGYPAFFAQGVEKFLEQRGTFLPEDAAVEPGLVVEVLHKEVEDGAAGSGLFIPCAVADALEPGVDDGPGAHGAGL